jgi:adenylyltransferase/sulfurtransferase
MVGTMQATEVIKLIAGIGEPLVGRLLMIDALSMNFRTLKLRKNPDCPVCSENPTQTELIDYEAFCGLPSTNGSSDESDTDKDTMSVPEVTVQDLKRRRDAGESPFVLDVRKPFEANIADIGADLLIPHEQVANRLDELEDYKDEEIVVHCRSGARSEEATRVLREHGFDAKNLKGGTLAWSKEIDDSVPTY